MFLLFLFYYSIGGIKMDLKNKIQQMTELGFTYGQLGKICNCAPATIAGWMRGATKISSRMKESIESHINAFIEKIVEIWK